MNGGKWWDRNGFSCFSPGGLFLFFFFLFFIFFFFSLTLRKFLRARPVFSSAASFCSSAGRVDSVD